MKISKINNANKPLQPKPLSPGHNGKVENRSLSTRLFLWCNAGLGKNKIYDKIISVAAFYLIYVLAAAVFIYGFFVIYSDNAAGFVSFVLFLALSFALAIAASYLTGRLAPNPRPAEILQGVKQAYAPLTSWKSFPSDHTIGAFILAESLIYIGAPPGVWIFALVTAFLVGSFRVLAGLHYPRDIVGGIVYGSVVAYLIFSFIM